MGKMHGDEATKQVNASIQIKALITDQGYIDCFIVGHSSDHDSKTVKTFMDVGADMFEPKPTNFNNVKGIVKKSIEVKDVARYFL